MTFKDFGAALDYFDAEYTRLGKPLSYSSLFTIVCDKIDKGEVRIQP